MTTAKNDKPAGASEDAKAKAKFREALEKKKSSAQRHNEGQRSTGAVHGSETTGPAQRMFRRKSGG